MMADRKLWDSYYMKILLAPGMINQDDKILDIGTGTNTTMLEVFGEIAEVVPSDLHLGKWNAHIPNMLQVDAEHASDSVAAEVSWDVIIMSELLEHVREPLDVLKQGLMLLKPGGKLILSIPFIYRIHDSTPNDPDVKEPYLKDYWRMTPDGLSYMLWKAGFALYWVGRLVKEGHDNWFPSGVVGWAIKGPITEPSRSPHVSAQADESGRVPEDDWNYELPADWRALQAGLVAGYNERLEQNNG